MKKLLLTAVVLAVFGTGYYVYQQNQDKPQPANNTQQNQNQQQTTNDQTEGGKYLVIKEWGVKIPLDEKIKNVSYKYNTEGYISITTPELEDFYIKHSECSPFSVPMQRIKPGDDHFGSPWTKEELELLSTEIKGSYYKEEVGKPCQGTGTAVEIPENILSIRSSLGESIKKVTPL